MRSRAAWGGAAAVLLLATGLMFAPALRVEGEPPERNPGGTARTEAWREAAPAMLVASAADPKASARRARQLEKALRVRAVDAGSLRGGASLGEGARLDLPLFDGATVVGTVRRSGEDGNGRRFVAGTLENGGTFTLAFADGELREALILPAGEGPVYRMVEAEGAGRLLAELPRDAVLCATLPRPPGTRATVAGITGPAGAAAGAAVTQPLLESRPGAEPVLYLDFDGQTVNDRVWNGGRTIEAAPSGLTEAEIRRVWRMVAEDYRPFRINVTTDPARYEAARPMQRIRCIITPTKEWYGDVGGVALIFSWRDAGSGVLAADVPCWVFSEPGVMTPEDVALAASHEAGHTLGLYHDGLRGEDGVTPPEGDYYAGQGAGATAWGPIMGAPYGKPLIQWSRGDYSQGLRVANNPEDDVALIATIENHTGFAAERRAETLGDAARLTVAADGVTVDHRGLIERAGAEAWLIFATGPGAVSLELAPEDPEVPAATNFDGSLTIATPGGAVVATVDQPGTCFPRLDASLPAGVYVLRVKSTGEGSPAAGGYSNYGSIGRYRIVGRINAASGVAPLIGGAPRGEGRAGGDFSYMIEAAGAGLAYSADNLPPGLSIANDGRIVGAPTAAGVWNTTVRAGNEAGLSSRAVVFAIAGAGLAEAVDAPLLGFSTGGARAWTVVAEADSPEGGSSARSGELLDDNGESWIEMRVTGPGRLSWLWRVSSEKDYDLFHVSLDGSLAAAISGEVGWTERSLEIPAGTHLVRWSYDKDDYLSERADSAWLDRVRWERGFEQWLAGASISGPAAAPDADPDGDGACNLLEYAFACDGRSQDGVTSLVQTTVSAPGGSSGAGEGNLQILFVRPLGREDLRYVVEVSGDLVEWRRGHSYGPGADNSGSELPTVEMERSSLPDGKERIRVRDTAAVGSSENARRFIRLRLERI